MAIDITLIHWIYISFILAVIGFMLFRRDTTIVCVVGILTLAATSTLSVSASITSLFNSFIFAITELLPTILVISIIVAMSKILTKSGINEVMVAPFSKIIKTPTTAFWTIGLLMMVISFFFWPSPAVALIGAVLLPVALRAGLPALGIAVAMNLFGHGIALSGDYIIQAAPKITADAAGIPVLDVVNASIPLVITMGLVTTITAYIILMRDLKKNKTYTSTSTCSSSPIEETQEGLMSERMKKILAISIPIIFVLDVVVMFTLNLQGGDATALIGGTALLILVVTTCFAHKKRGLEETTGYLIEGFQFGFKVFGPVIPIAAFFYLGDAGFYSIVGDYLPENSEGIVNDLGVALANGVPLTKEVGVITLTGVGVITGLDGSGFSGISLAGSIAQLFSTAIGASTATLTALGQVTAIWVGGGTLVPWALIPAAAICGVDPFELARKNLLPVSIGLVITTIVAMFLV
ncbi:hypothetical protein [Bacillus weihaiensis]|uniref:Transporter n=1 Tax=Bacillus weihaiensis TaxID=1547283 RepID=A0A1L3MUM1_9BACI|nr:hypothetical protein [Bacillus weihaiensis]APH06019.1 hypothetical protein A9C19_15440 [Bacillus weihaiensis]